jgi:uncharacterized protein (DUF362 family)
MNLQALVGSRLSLHRTMDFTARGTVLINDFKNWGESLHQLLDAARAFRVLGGQRTVLIKPNLVEALKPPVTTPVEGVSCLIDYLRDISPDVEIIVGEGSGAKDYDTWRAFEALGYAAMAREKAVRLVDLNNEPLVRLTRPDCRRWPEMHLPKIVFDSYLISFPVLKVHTLASVTLAMKNMIGIAPPRYYQKEGFWKKASFHDGIHEAIFDLNRYRAPDFVIIDATVGMREAHLYGPTCDPPPNLLICSKDPVAADACGAGLLKKDWRRINHILLADGVLGSADPLRIVRVS